jgi:hypothetical protein
VALAVTKLHQWKPSLRFCSMQHPDTNWYTLPIASNGQQPMPTAWRARRVMRAFRELREDAQRLRAEKF